MREFGHLGKQPQLLNIEKLEKLDKFAGQKIEKCDIDAKPKYTIDEILDKVEEGDVSILVELGISYTEITTETGNKQISFKYEGIRYTVNIIDNANTNNEVEQENSNNTQTVKNDDGSYTVYEYSTDGSSLLKSTEYDKDGRITHEYTLKDDGSRSDKYYTYENGTLAQIQETIHYTDGNYTYIFTDGNGNLIEEQKVIHNELGGLTFDTTFGDGTRSVIVCDSNEQVVNHTFYTSNGELEKTEEYNYDSNNPNLYTVVTKNADGRIISEANWENYSFTDDNGSTWFGSRMLARINYDTNGNIYDITHFEYKDYNSPANINYINSSDSQFLNKLKNLAKEYQKQLDDISIQMRSLDIPIPPNAIDYKKSSDGSIDENAYNKAMQQYNEQIISYHNQIDKLNKKSMEILNKLQQINKQITELEFEAKFESIGNTINSLKNTSNTNNELINILETTLENIKQSISDLPKKKLELQNKLQSIFSQILSIKVPTPPSASNFTKPDGSVDEEAYEAAFNDYENEKYQYDKIISQLDAQASVLRNEIAQIDIEIEKQTSKLNQLEKTVNAIKTVQDLVGGIENKITQLRESGNNAKANELEAKLNNLKKEFNLIQEQRKSLLNRENMLLNRLNRISTPVPPSTNDYKTEDGNIDEKAYEHAVKNYEKQKNQYNRITRNIFKQLNIISEKLTTLDNKLLEIQEKIMDLTKI